MGRPQLEFVARSDICYALQHLGRCRGTYVYVYIICIYVPGLRFLGPPAWEGDSLFRSLISVGIPCSRALKRGPFAPFGDLLQESLRWRMSQVRTFMRHAKFFMITRQVDDVDQNQKVKRPEPLVSICFVLFGRRRSSLASLKSHHPP